MGSSGSGNFSDYSGAKKVDTNGGGGASGSDRCLQAFSTELEEVGQCEYFVKYQTVPIAGDQLNIIFSKRIFAVDIQGNKVGALPTSFNYLAACLKDGITYVGVVKFSTLKPFPAVEVDFVPK